MATPDSDPRVVYLPNLALFAVMLTVATVFLAVDSFVGDRNPVKERACTAAAVAAHVFLFTVGRKALKGRWPLKRGQRIGVTASQACWVTLLVMVIALFHNWLLR